MSAVRDLLVKARALIAEPENWTKGEWEDVNAVGNSCYCADGALLEASGEYHSLNNAYSQAYGILSKIANKHPKSRLGGLISFNDLDGTTHEDVLAVFDAAIASVDA